jgi:mono/diheme cytochrome c family protein
LISISKKFLQACLIESQKRGDDLMKRILRCSGVIMFIFLLTGFLRVPGADGDELQRGKDLYAAKCLICHGANGRGDGPAAAAFTPKPANFTSPSFWKDKTPDKIASIITKGEGHMPAFNFNPNEIKEIIDYLEHTFKK